MTVDLPSGGGETPLVRVLLPWGDGPALTYLWPRERLGEPSPGVRVEVPLGAGRRVGILLGKGGGEDPLPGKLREVGRVLDEVAVWTPDVLALVLWASGYYHVPPGDFVRLALPPLLRRAGRAQRGEDASLPGTEGGPARPPPGVPEADGFRPAARRGPLSFGAFSPRAFLERLASPEGLPPFFASGSPSARAALLGEAAARVVGQGRSVLVLAPELRRAEDLARALDAHGLAPLVYSAALTPRERARLWMEFARGHHPVVVGSRAAVFLPRVALGLLAVEDEHDESYRQEGVVPYHARDLAVVRARLSGAAVLLASDTPAVETVRNLRLRRYARVSPLVDPSGGPVSRPAVTRRDPRRPGSVGGLAAASLEAIADHLGGGGTVAVYLNRKGYARALVCPSCGWRARCARCGADEAVHLASESLVCPRCAAREPLLTFCPACRGPLRPRGGGLERLVHVLRSRFPAEAVALCEAGSASPPEGARILVGTRRLVPLLDARPTSLLVVADADAALANPAFRARERFAQDCFALLARLRPAGSCRPEAIVQSRGADEETLAVLLRGPYARFARFEDEARRRDRLPPYAAWALVEAGGGDASRVESFLAEIREMLARRGEGAVAAFGPLPFPARRGERSRARLLLQADSRAALHRALDALAEGARARRGRPRWRVLVDPESLF